MIVTTRTGRWCAWVVQLAASLLPAGQQQRYALEFLAELHGMRSSRQIRHSLQVLASALQLRAALTEAGTSSSQENPMITAATRHPLRCLCGRDRTEKVGSDPWSGAAAAP